jgi:hypothetical protein
MGPVLAALALAAATVVIAVADQGTGLPTGEANAPGSDDAEEATELLAGQAFTTHGGGSVTDATTDRTLHLCADGRFVLQATFMSTSAETVSEQETTGTWEVTGTRQGEGGELSAATVGYTLDGGGGGSVTVLRAGDGATFDGLPAAAAPSTRC